MSMNKFMHPRNKYRKPPDFKALAIKYPDFRKHAKQDITGKVKFNFKSKEALSALTHTLLKEDFGLDVEIPATRLVPTLPLRLNYLLWIEDILISNGKMSETVTGIDIGCGASCVYPLLAAKQFKWHMLGTEIDTDSAFIASNNVRKNNLQAMIKVRTVDEEKLLVGVIDENTVYDFCMCNPPFFSSTDELEPQSVARSAKRSLPRNAHSGATHELVVEGGEMAFVNKIIQESLKLKRQIRVYSVMLGHKTSLTKTKQALRDVDIQNLITVEFCQGRTTRWGVAWTLDADVILPKTTEGNSLKKAKEEKKKATPFSWTFATDLPSTVERLKQLMDQLQITYSNLKNTEELVSMEITAKTNTWTNSRKKRRQEKLLKLSTLKEDESQEMVVESGNHELENQNEEPEINQSKADCQRDSGDGKDIIDNEDCLPSVSNVSKENLSNEKGIKRARDEGGGSEDEETAKKRLKTEEPANSDKGESFFNGLLVVKESAEGAIVELNWLRGPGGRDSAHQVLHYFKNHFKTET